MKTEVPQLSIITPCFNEEESVLKCFESLRDVMSKDLPGVTYAHIFADNGSTDNTVETIKSFLKIDSRVKLIVNSKNIGAPLNIYRAMSRTSGLAVIPMLPADLQDPAEVIPDFYGQWKAGYRWGKREFGKSKATPFVLIDIAINGLVSTSRLPARITLLSGFMFSPIGILFGVWSLLASFFSSTSIGSGIPTIIVAIFFIGGIQLFFLGLIGEYVLSIHGEIRPEPGAFDLETIGFEKWEVRNRNER